MFVVTPFLYPLDAPIHIISNLKNPESHHIPPQFEQSLISELISVAQLAAPTSMIHFTIDLNVELSAIWEEDGQVQAIPVSRILRHCSDSSIVELGIQDLLPLRYHGRSGHIRILACQSICSSISLFRCPSRQLSIIVCKLPQILNVTSRAILIVTNYYKC